MIEEVCGIYVRDVFSVFYELLQKLCQCVILSGLYVSSFKLVRACTGLTWCLVVRHFHGFWVFWLFWNIIFSWFFGKRIPFFFNLSKSLQVDNFNVLNSLDSKYYMLNGLIIESNSIFNDLKTCSLRLVEL